MKATRLTLIMMHKSSSRCFFLLILVLLIHTSHAHAQNFLSRPPAPNVLGPGPTGAIYVVPLPSVGVSLAGCDCSDGVVAKPAVSYSLGIAGAFYLLGGKSFVTWLAPVAEVSYDSHGALLTGPNGFGSKLRADYLMFSSGLQIYHAFTLVLNVGIPLSLTTTTPVSGNSDLVTTPSTSMLNTLTEARLVLAAPIGQRGSAGPALIGFISLAYPLNTMFRDRFDLIDGSGKLRGSVASLRLPSIQFGLTLAFVPYIRYPN